MMLKFQLLVLLASSALAKKCRDFKVPVEISATNMDFDYKPTDDEVETTNFLLRLTRNGFNYPQSILRGSKVVSGKYELATTYCEPDSGPGDTIQILTHGIGFDRTYWDYPFEIHNFSYVNHAVNQGYSTLTWDRLGVGMSSHGDPINEIQIFLEIAALHALSEKVRKGDLCGLKATFKKHVQIGHSFGSSMIYGFSSLYPNSTDAIVLTGFSQLSKYIPYVALGDNFAPVRSIDTLRHKYSAGYVAPATSIGYHTNFFGTDDFSKAILDYSTKGGQPATLGELLTIGAPPSSPSHYGGHVLIIAGEYDIPFCGGNCRGVESAGIANNVLELSRPNFKKAKTFKTTVVDKAGHGFNLGYHHAAAYKNILDFLHSVL